MNPLRNLTAHPVIGHRGAAGPAPENTLAALRLGLEQGADALEFDLRLAACGTPVLMHDPLLDRTTALTGPVGAHDAATLAGYGVPTLADVLQEFPQTPLLIELKTVEVAAPARQVLQKHDAVERVVVASFLDAALQPFRSSGFATSASRRGILAWWIGLRGALSGVRDEVFSVPDRYKGWLPVPTRRFVKAARRAGKPVHVWTVNDPDQAAGLWKLGVSGIVTDLPGRIREARDRILR